MKLQRAGAHFGSTAPSSLSRVRAVAVASTAASPSTSSPPSLRPQHDIRLICSDVDGTLLDSNQILTTGVEAAVMRAADAGVPLVVATGKARGPWAKEVLPRLGRQPMPGVFLQGLLIYDAEGKVIYEQSLPDDICLDVFRLAKSRGVTVTAYCGERILAEAIDRHTERLAFYKEPDVETVGPLSGLVGSISVQKLIFMADQDQIDLLRPEAEALLKGRASLTTALEGMLVVLPLGTSKGSGVAWLLNHHLHIDPKHVMALGDGENDVEMLSLVGWGVAMGNGGARAKAAAAAVVASNNEDGVAQAIDRFVLSQASSPDGSK